MWRFCWHDWTPWHTYAWRGAQYGNLLTGDTTSSIKISKTMQARRCRKCGKEIHRTISGADGSMLQQTKKTT